MKFLTRQEEFILLAVHYLRDGAYLVEIQKYLNKITKKKWSISSIYLPLNKMEKAGLLNTNIGEPSARRGGKAIKYYSLSADGYEALTKIQEVLNKMWGDNPDLVREK